MSAGDGTLTSGPWALTQPRATRAPAVHHEAVVHVDERMDRVDVRDETAGGLRLTGGEDVLRVQPAEHGRGLVAHPFTHA